MIHSYSLNVLILRNYFFNFKNLLDIESKVFWEYYKVTTLECDQISKAFPSNFLRDLTAGSTINFIKHGEIKDGDPHFTFSFPMGGVHHQKNLRRCGE